MRSLITIYGEFMIYGPTNTRAIGETGIDRERGVLLDMGETRRPIIKLGGVGRVTIIL